MTVSAEVKLLDQMNTLYKLQEEAKREGGAL